MVKAKLVVIGALLFFGICPLDAQTSTYLVLKPAFSLSMKAQSSGQKLTNITITTKDLIHAIGIATTNRFSSHAQLLFLFRLGGGVPFFLIRDGSYELNTGQFLTAGQVGQPVTQFKESASGAISGTVYVCEDFRLVNIPGWGFEVHGFNINPQSNRGIGPGLPPGPLSISVDAVGAGSLAGKPAVLRGRISAVRHNLEQRAEAQERIESEAERPH